MDATKKRAGNPAALMLLERLDKIDADRATDRATIDKLKTTIGKMEADRTTDRAIIENHEQSLRTLQQHIADLQSRSDTMADIHIGELEMMRKQRGDGSPD